MTRRLGAGVALAVIVMCSPLAARADSTPIPSPSPACRDTDTSADCVQKRALDRVHAQLAANLAGAQVAQKQLADSIAENARQQEELRGRVAAAEAQVQALDAEISRQERQILTLEAEIAQERAQIRVLARAIYFQPTSILVLVASSRSARDLVAGTADLMAAGERASEIERTIDEHRAEVVAARAKSQHARAVQDQLRRQSAADLATIAKLGEQQAVISQQLNLKIAQTRSEIAAVDHQSADVAAKIAARLQAEQEQIIAEAMAHAWAQAMAWIAANPGVPGVSPGHSQDSRFVWPEQPAQITQAYGPTDLALEPPYMGAPHFHTGIDLAAPRGTPVRAADDGVVAVVGDGTTGYGRYVILSHRNGLATLYGHLDQAVVKVGDQIVQGQPVGLEGSTGNSTGPHVHFELRLKGVPQDPTPLLPPGPPA